jgi:hypothetical protein
MTSIDLAMSRRSLGDGCSTAVAKGRKSWESSWDAKGALHGTGLAMRSGPHSRVARSGEIWGVNLVSITRRFLMSSTTEPKSRFGSVFQVGELAYLNGWITIQRGSWMCFRRDEIQLVSSRREYIRVGYFGISWGFDAYFGERTAVKVCLSSYVTTGPIAPAFWRLI